jgi:hypothetical protein
LMKAVLHPNGEKGVAIGNVFEIEDRFDKTNVVTSVSSARNDGK